MTDIASLVARIDATSADEARQKLDQFTASGGRAETQVEKLGSASAAAAAGITDAGQAARAATVHFDTMFDQAQRDFSTQWVAQQGRIQTAGRLTQLEMLNLGRQFSDVGVSIASGMPIWMVAIQQGSQIQDVFATAATRGVGFRAALAGLAGTAATLAAALAPIAAIGGGLFVAASVGAKELNDANKDLIDTLGLTEKQIEKIGNTSITAGDVMTGVWRATSKAMSSAFGDEIAAVQGAFSRWYEWQVTSVIQNTKTYVGAYVGAYEAIKAVWSNLPAALGDAAMSAVNAVITATETMINKAIEGVNKLRPAINAALMIMNVPMRMPELDQVSLGRFQNQFAGGMQRAATAGTTAFAEGFARGGAMVEAAAVAVARETLGAWGDRMLREAGKAEEGHKKAARAAKEHADEAEKLRRELERLLTGIQAIEDRLGGPAAQAQRRFGEETELLYQALMRGALPYEKWVALSDALRAELDLAIVGVRNLDTSASSLVKVPVVSFTQDWIDKAVRAAQEFDNIAYSVEGVFAAFQNGDWSGAMSGLIRSIDMVTEAWARSKTEAALAVAAGIGQAIGGRAGSAISGAASGAMMGFQFGGPVGAVIGGGLGLLGGLFGGGGEKKRQREEEERRKAEEAARKAAEIAAQAREFELRIIELTQGATAALAERRKDELAATDASNRAALERIWQLEDEAEAAAKASALAVQRQDIELEILRLTGQEAAAVAIERQRELEALDPSLRALKERVFALQDEAEAARIASTVGKTFAADLAALFGGPKATWLDIARANRASELAAERAAAEKAKEAAAEAATAWSEFVAQVDAAAPALIRAGDAIGALAGEMSKVKLTGDFTLPDGSWNNVNYNLAIAKAQAEAAQRLSNMASGMSLSVENVGGFLDDLRSQVGDRRYAILGEQAIKTELRSIAAAVGEGYNNAIRDAVSGLAEVVGLEGVRRQYQANGGGLAGVRFAQETLGFVSASPWAGKYGIGEDVAAYGMALDRLKGLLNVGKISLGDYTRAVEGLDEVMGSAVDYVGDMAAQMERVEEATRALGDAGLSSISQAFGQITSAADALAAAAKEANEPIAQVTGAIGRLISYAQVFGESAQAAIQGGQGEVGSVGTASLIAKAASIAAGIITTQQAKALAEATGLDKGLTLLLDGLQAFDPASFENAFLRLNNALVTGSISAAEYQQLFQTSIGIFDGTAEALDSVRKAARSLADELLVSDLSTLGPSALFGEANRQWQNVFGQALGGANVDLSGPARTMLEAGKASFASDFEYRRLFARTISDLRGLEQLPSVDYAMETAGNTANMVSELQALRQEVAQMRVEQRVTGEKTAINTGKLARNDDERMRYSDEVGA